MYEGYFPQTSGLLSGSGGLAAFQRRKQAIQRRGRNFPDVMMQNTKEVRELVPDFDPALEKEYTPRELMLLAERMLLMDRDESPDGPRFFDMRQLRLQQKREIYCGAGVPDPGIVSGLFNRTHPLGRPWRTKAERLVNGGSFYKP